MLFISYSRRNKEQVYPFVEGLTAAGVDVWIDREEIDPLDDFPARIREGLAHSNALLAWYSPEYAQSSYCQKELTAAWICARRLTRDVLSRILVVNPEDNVAHIALGDVGKQNYLSARPQSIQVIRENLARLTDDFAAVRDFKAPEWYPAAQQGSARFVGRLRELWAIHAALDNTRSVVQLCGSAGVGKSLLTIEYAQRFGAAYPGGIHWLRAYGFDPNKQGDAEDRERECRVQIENLAFRQGVPVADKKSPEIRRELGQKIETGGRYLWVVDDLAAGLDRERAVPEWCAPSANGCTLITTGSREYEGIGSRIEVEELEPEAALELLAQKRQPQTEGEREAAEGLAEDLGRHALALDVAGHILSQTRDVAALREEIAGSDPLGELAAGLRGELPDGHEKSIVATLVASLRLLGEQGRSLLRLACELHGGTPIPLCLARDVFQRAFALEERAAADYLALAVNQAEMRCLANVSSGGAGGGILSVHSLVRYSMQHGDPAEGDAPALRAKLREAAVAALGEMLEDLAGIDEYARLELEIAHARWLPCSESERGNYREALAIEQRMLPVWERALGRDHSETLTSRHNIATFIGRAGDGREALRLFRKLLPDKERALGRDHPNTLAARNNIAAWTGETGDAREALRLFRELLPDRERVQGRDHPSTLTARNNVATWTAEAGDAREALRLFRLLLPDLERVHGRDHRSTLTTRNNIADLTGRIDQVREALRLFGLLLPDMERVLGRDHPRTLTVRNNLASLTGRAGQKREALRLFRELLPDLERVLGHDHPSTLTVRSNLAHWTGLAGQGREALRQFRELLPDMERVQGRDHPDTLTTRANIAFWMWRTGEEREGLRLLRELLPDQERVLGPQHPATLAARENIARLESPWMRVLLRLAARLGG